VFATLFITDLNNRKGKLFDLSRFSPPLYVKGEDRGDPLSGTFQEAMAHYHNRDHKRAYRMIRTIGPGNSQIWYFRGILALLNGENRDALEQFNKIVYAMSPSYYDEALYYRGICYLRLNRKNKALKEFKTLESMYSPLREKAADMVKKISEL
jgi:tetratricopeptide (TPR) repeat protein